MLSGVVRLIANHRSSPSSKARQKALPALDTPHGPPPNRGVEDATSDGPRRLGALRNPG
jgi:hypothetical protein